MLACSSLAADCNGFIRTDEHLCCLHRNCARGNHWSRLFTSAEKTLAKSLNKKARLFVFSKTEQNSSNIIFRRILIKILRRSEFLCGPFLSEKGVQTHEKGVTQILAPAGGCLCGSSDPKIDNCAKVPCVWGNLQPDCTVRHFSLFLRHSSWRSCWYL